MDNSELFGDRKKALEEEFFRRQEEKLIAKLRDEEQQREARRALSEASGISDDAVLDRLIQMGIGARTLAPLSLVPLVEVAWADGKLDPRERDAVLAAAKEAGLDPTSPGYGLLETWLSTRPDAHLQELWAEYTRSLCAALAPEDRAALRDEILGRARRVAEAAGGFLGLGSKVSRAEEQVLNELVKAFGE
jgi:hypothetical protein